MHQCVGELAPARKVGADGAVPLRDDRIAAGRGLERVEDVHCEVPMQILELEAFDAAVEAPDVDTALVLLAGPARLLLTGGGCGHDAGCRTEQRRVGVQQRGALRESIDAGRNVPLLHELPNRLPIRSAQQCSPLGAIAIVLKRSADELFDKRPHGLQVLVAPVRDGGQGGIGFTGRVFDDGGNPVPQ